MVFRDIFDKPSGRIHGLATLTGESFFCLFLGGMLFVVLGGGGVDRGG